jgi:hypothetical protein
MFWSFFFCDLLIKIQVKAAPRAIAAMTPTTIPAMAPAPRLLLPEDSPSMFAALPDVLSPEGLVFVCVALVVVGALSVFWSVERELPQLEEVVAVAVRSSCGSNVYELADG